MKTVDWAKWSAIAEIVGAIAVVVTLLYLSTQTKQNTAALRASVRQEMFANDQTILFKGMDTQSCQMDTHSKAWSSPDCARSSFLIFLRSRENNWLQYRDGVIDDVTYESYNKALRAALSSPEGSELWPRLRPYLSDAFGEYVDQLRGELPNESLDRR